MHALGRAILYAPRARGAFKCRPCRAARKQTLRHKSAAFHSNGYYECVLVPVHTLQQCTANFVMALSRWRVLLAG